MDVFITPWFYKVFAYKIIILLGQFYLNKAREKPLKTFLQNTDREFFFFNVCAHGRTSTHPSIYFFILPPLMTAK
jgi:hypothetical protein